MKKSLIFFILLFTVLINTTVVFSQDPANIPLNFYGGTIRQWSVSEDGNTIYVGGPSTVYMSSNRGVNWQQLNPYLVNGGLCVTANGAVYISGFPISLLDGRILRTTNNGASWDTAYKSGVAGSICNNIAASASGNKMAALYKANSGATSSILYSTNAGSNWSALEIPANNYFTPSGYIDVAFDGEKLVITDKSGIIIFGNGWRFIASNITNRCSYVKNNTIIMAGYVDSLPAVSTYRNGQMVREELPQPGAMGSGIYSISVKNNRIFVVGIAIQSSGITSSYVYEKRGNGAWSLNNTFPFSLTGSYIRNNELFLHGRDNIVIVNLTLTSVGTGEGQGMPEKYELKQNFPNPFNPETTIVFSIVQQTAVTLRIYNLLGREVATLIRGEVKEAGNYTISFNAANLSSGAYFYRMEAGDYSETKRMTLIK